MPVVQGSLSYATKPNGPAFDVSGQDGLMESPGAGNPEYDTGSLNADVMLPFSDGLGRLRASGCNIDIFVLFQKGCVPEANRQS